MRRARAPISASRAWFATITAPCRHNAGNCAAKKRAVRYRPGIRTTGNDMVRLRLLEGADGDRFAPARAGQASVVVHQPVHAHVPRALRATEDAVAGLHAVPDDRALAMRAARRDGVDRALECIEDVRLAVGIDDGERTCIVVAAHFAGAHGSLLCRSEQATRLQR